MKRLLLVCTLFFTLACSAQVKISQMTNWTGAMDSAYVPIVVNLVNYKTLGTNLSKERIDSIVNNWPVGGGSGIMSIEGNNAITVLTDSIVQLGAPNNSSVPLTANRWINTSTFILTVRGSSSNYPLQVENTGTGFAAQFISTDNAAIKATRTPATVNNYLPTLELIRSGSGSASAGIGNNIDFYNWIDASNGNTYSGSAGMGWTNTTYATRTSEYSVTLVNSGSTINRFLLSGSGAIKATGYGDGTHTGTPTHYITSDADGNFIEVAYTPPGGGGSGIQSIEGQNGTVVVNDSIVKLGTNPLIENTVIDGDNFYLRFTDTRVQEDLGTSIAAANDLTLGADGNTFSITGATQINAITTANWQAGSVVRLIFASTPTVKHNTAGGAGTAVIQLSGAVDYTAATNDVLTLVYDGTDWHETSRKLMASGGGSLRFGVTGEDVLATANRAFSMGTSQTFTISGTYSTSGQMFLLSNAGTNSTFGATSNNGSATGTFQNSGSGPGLNITSSSGSAITASTTTGTQVATLTTTPSSTNTTVSVLTLRRNTSATAANNMAGALLFDLEGASGNTLQANKFVWRWNTATEASRESSLLIEGAAAGANQSVMEIVGTGNVKLLVAGKGLALTSPDGTLWYITVSNAGVLSTSTSAP